MAIEQTLQDLDDWYNQSLANTERILLLSKLANIELGGWLEEEFDRLIRQVARNRISNEKWLERDVIKNANGFKYKNHWRVMLTKVVGEMFAERIEAEMEAKYPTELDCLDTLLNRLWDERCKFAHSDLEANKYDCSRQQLQFNAPSHTISEYRVLQKILINYKSVLLTTLPAL